MERERICWFRMKEKYNRLFKELLCEENFLMVERKYVIYKEFQVGEKH